jgi:hypothetical protein
MLAGTRRANESDGLGLGGFESGENSVQEVLFVYLDEPALQFHRELHGVAVRIIIGQLLKGPP